MSHAADRQGARTALAGLTLELSPPTTNVRPRPDSPIRLDTNALKIWAMMKELKSTDSAGLYTFFCS